MDTEKAAGAPEAKAEDISSFDTVVESGKGAEMEVRNPKSGDVMRHADGHPFTITLRGRDSEEVRAVMRGQSDRRISSTMRTRAPILTATVERDDVEVLVAATISWDVVLQGEKAPSDPKAYRAAYIRYPWLKDQVDEFIGVRSNFIKS